MPTFCVLVVAVCSRFPADLHCRSAFRSPTQTASGLLGRPLDQRPQSTSTLLSLPITTQGFFPAS